MLDYIALYGNGRRWLLGDGQLMGVMRALFRNLMPPMAGCHAGANYYHFYLLSRAVVQAAG